MSKGKYTHMQGLEKEILAMREAGATRQEIDSGLFRIKSSTNQELD